MTRTSLTEIIDISDSESDNSSLGQDEKPTAAVFGSQFLASDSDSVLVIESSDSDVSDWNDSDGQDEFSEIMGQLVLNSQPNAFPTIPSGAGGAPRHLSTAANETIVLSSSDDESSFMPLISRQEAPKNVPSTTKAQRLPTTAPKPSTSSSSKNIPRSIQTVPNTAKDLKKVDAKLYRDVNKLVIDRKSTIKDFTVEISCTLQDLPFVALFSEKLETHHGRTAFFEPPKGVERLIRFRRQHTARYDNLLKEWIPVEAHTRLEDLYIMFLSADQLTQAISEDSLATTVSDLRNTHRLTNRSQIFLLIDGMNAYYKRKGGRKVKRDVVEFGMTFLQAVERCFIVHVEGPEDTAQWLFNITSDLGIKPHKRIRDSFLPFCTDTKVKCGTSKDDTYKKMLQQIHGITESAADGIFQEVPTLRILFEGYDEEANTQARYERLREVTVSNRKDGVAKSRILNQALSKKVHDVIWGEDPLTLVL